MIDLIKETGIRGTSMWSINNYFIRGYFDNGNPISYWCNWSNKIADHFDLPNRE